MTATLVYGGLTLTGGSPYEIMLSGADLGNPKPVTTAVRSLFLDGSVVTGKFSDNRTIAFQVLIKASTATATTAALDALAYQVDQQTNVITWTPDTGLAQAFDTFRGELHESFDWDGRSSTQRLVTVSMPALPFGRTPGVTSLGSSTVASVLLDGFEASPEPSYMATGYSSTAMTRVSTGPAPYSGTYSANAPFNILGTYGSAEFFQTSNTFASVSITGRTIVEMQVWLSCVLSNIYGAQVVNDPVTWTTGTLTLTSAGGSSTWTVDPKLVGKTRVWAPVQFDLTATPASTTGSGYSAGAVTGYTFRLDGTSAYSGAYGPYGSSLNVDDLRAYPPGYSVVSSADAGSYLLTPVVGSARTPMDLRIDRGGTNTLTDLLVYEVPTEAVTGYQPLLVGTSPYSTTTGVNLAGTFTVLGTIKSASQAAANSMALSIQQTENGTNVGSAWTSGTLVTTGGDAYIIFGEVTLPLVGTSAANTGVAYTLTLSGTDASTVLDLFLLDTRGALVLVGPAPVTAAKYFFIAAPQPATGVGGVFSGSASDLSDATAVTTLRMSGGQMSLNPGSNTLVVAATDAISDLVVTATYAPRWLTERTS